MTSDDEALKHHETVADAAEVSLVCRTNDTEQYYFQGASWSPDGLCVLTASEDASVRLYELRDASLECVVCVREAEIVYSYCWYPRMHSSDAPTCCFASCGRDQPVHLWDAFNGELRASYSCFDNADELTAVNSLAFNPSGEKLFCGRRNAIACFDITRPGRDYDEWCTVHRDGGADNIPGIISAFAFNSDSVAAGSYNGSIGLFDLHSGEVYARLHAAHAGVTQLHFSECGNYLFCGGRRHNAILCWDIRRGECAPLHAFSRASHTHQRIEFDVSRDGRYVFTGSHDGHILVYDVNEAALYPDVCMAYDEGVHVCVSPTIITIRNAHNDAVNGISVHPSQHMIVTASGQRHYEAIDSDDDEDIESSTSCDNSLRVWNIDWTSS